MSGRAARRLAHGAIAAILILTFWACAISPTSPFQIATVPTAPRQCPKAPSGPAAWTKEPNYRQVLISAHNQNNLAPPKLTLANLRLYQSGKQLQIVYLQPQPVTVGILVENSGSMEPKLPQTRAALADFIRGLNPGDEIFVDAFSDRPFTLAELSTDHKVAIDHLGMMRAYGRTALYDVIIQGLQTVSQGCNQRKALVVLTDGMDTASSSSLDQVTKDAQSVKVPICSIGIGDPTASSSGGRWFISALPPCQAAVRLSRPLSSSPEQMTRKESTRKPSINCPHGPLERLSSSRSEAKKTRLNRQPPMSRGRLAISTPSDSWAMERLVSYSSE